MNWSNWTTYANQVLGWFLGLFPQLLSLVMENPLLGVPVIIGIIGLVLNLVLRFVGALGSNKKSES